MERISGYRVLVLGDAILDEYVYVRPQGKSPKENIITNKILRSERFKGGVWAAAEHIKGFCEDVRTVYGSQVTTKRRFVEDGYIRKLFEVHETEDGLAMVALANIPDFDLVVVTDFGHGCLNPALIAQLEKEAVFLAVNAQTNSANHGFNLITKYKRADYVVLDELEARLAAHDRESPIESVIERLGFKRIVVTLGPRGAIGYDGGFTYAKAASDRVVDTMGAGDAFFCVTAPLAAAGAGMETLLAVGNAAGAAKCAVIGHRKAVNMADILHLVETACV
jgi:bifunctional ADP-heptose synthase (sugar kinase/adenylyltransferase)